jgi:hypothetical protein
MAQDTGSVLFLPAMQEIDDTSRYHLGRTPTIMLASRKMLVAPLQVILDPPRQLSIFFEISISYLTDGG